MVRMRCGHNSDWTVRMIDKGQRYIYCLGCLYEKVGLLTVDGRIPDKSYPVGMKIPKEEKQKTTKVDKKE